MFCRGWSCALFGALVAMPLAVSSMAAAQAPQPCPGLRAVNGQCAAPDLVAGNNVRSGVFASGYASYFGTPLGTVGTGPIDHQRVYRTGPLPEAPPLTVVFAPGSPAPTPPPGSTTVVNAGSFVTVIASPFRCLFIACSPVIK